jgi:HSP20 family molecular chaperone IbpA
MQNVEVTVEKQVLKIRASEQASGTKGEAGKMQSTRKAAFSQLLTLPGPVDVQKMEVEKKEGMLVVTLPKTK